MKKWRLAVFLCAAVILGTAILLSVLIPEPVDDMALFRQGLVPVKVGDKWGYANRRGEIVIRPQFFQAYNFDDSSLAAVVPEKSQGYGFINTRGEFVIEPKFFHTEPIGFFQGLAVVRENGSDLWGYIDKKGNYVIAPQFSSAKPFSDNGLAAVRVEDKYGYIDKTGAFVIPPRFREAGDFDRNGYAIVREGDRGLIDQKGNYVIQPEYSYLRLREDGAYIAEDYGSLNVGYIDPKTDVHIPAQFKHIGTFAKNGLAVASEDYLGPFGYIDRTGSFVIPPQFDSASDFGDNELARVRAEKDGLYGYIDSTGNFVIQPQFEYARGFEDRCVAIVTKDGQDGLIDSQGNYVLQPQALDLWGFARDGLTLAGDTDGYTVVDQTGQPLFTEHFQEIIRLDAFDCPMQVYFSDGYAIVSENGKYGVIDKKGRYVLEPEFDYIGGFLYYEPADCY